MYQSVILEPQQCYAPHCHRILHASNVHGHFEGFYSLKSTIILVPMNMLLSGSVLTNADAF